MKKYAAFLFSAVLCASLIAGKVIPADAQQEGVRLEESGEGDHGNLDTEDVEDLEENTAGGSEEETDLTDPKESEAETAGSSEESEIPDASDASETSDVSETSGTDQDNPTEEEELQTDSSENEESESPDETPDETLVPGETLVPDETKVQEEQDVNPDVGAAMETAHIGFYEHIYNIAELLDISDNYTLVEGEDNFYEALAIYAVKHNQTRNYPYDVEITSEADFDELQSIYWSLNMVYGAKNEADSVIYVTRRSGLDVYVLSGSEKKLFQSLITEESREKVHALVLN
ncbi:hypothetical protein [Lacrimispora brassicae]